MSFPAEALPNARAVQEYLEFLACPHCKGRLERTPPSKLTCCGCGRTFEVVENFPVLLPSFLSSGHSWREWKGLETECHKFYGHWSKEDHLSVQPLYRAFYDWCGVRDSKNVRVLDIGGANGVHRLIHWNYPETIAYFNLDPEIRLLHPFYFELYPREREVDFPYVVGVGEYLPFQSNTFDICVTTAAVDHYESPVDVFHEVFRCLKPRCKLYMMVTKHGALPRSGILKKGLPRLSEYRRRHGILAAGKRIVSRISLLPRLLKPQKEAAHIHRFSSVEELTDLLHMFTVTRTKEADVCERTVFYIECRKE